MDLKAFLGLLAGGTVISTVLSFMAERWAWFQRLSPRGRWWLVVAVCFGLPLVGWGGGVGMGYITPPVVWQGWVESVFAELVIGGTAWISTQCGHASVNKRLTKTG